MLRYSKLSASIICLISSTDLPFAIRFSLLSISVPKQQTSINAGDAILKCTSLAPAFLKVFTIPVKVVPLTIESSIKTIFLPLILFFNGFSFSATNFVWDTLWDYVPGQFIVEQAGGVIYNDTKIHIAANNESFLEIIKKNTTIKDKEQIILKK